MNIKNLGLLLAVFSVLLVAGCVGGPFQSLFGGGGGTVNEAPPDIITVQNQNTVPQPPVLASDEFTISFEVKNVDDINSVSNVNVQLYDWGLCSESKLAPPVGEWTKDTGTSVYKQPLGKMSPGQSKPLTLTLGAPSREQLGNLPGRCPVKYKVTYDFTSSTSTSAEVISSDRLHQLQTAGQQPTFTPVTDIGRGPIKIYMAPVGSLPARNGTTLYISLQVQNKGSGTYLNIAKGKLLLKAPDTWVLTDACGGEFTNSTGPKDNYQTYFNNNTRGIDLVGTDKQTFEIRCGFTMPNVQETKDYFLFSSLDYTYDLIQEVGVDITP